jgi:putative zinc finger protein
MNDCQNAAIRDQLPDVLHDRLDARARTVVLAHVDGCNDCQSELALLRGVHGMLIARTPRVDVHYVVGALPLAARRRSARPVARHRTWADWRIAAAVTVLAVGGGSVAVLHRSTPMTPVAARVAASPATTSPASAGPLATVPANLPSASNAGAGPSTVASIGAGSTGISMGGRLDDLSDDQLQALLDQVGDLQAIPITEPDPVAIQVESTSGAVPEGA